MYRRTATTRKKETAEREVLLLSAAASAAMEVPVASKPCVPPVLSAFYACTGSESLGLPPGGDGKVVSVIQGSIDSQRESRDRDGWMSLRGLEQAHPRDVPLKYCHWPVPLLAPLPNSEPMAMCWAGGALGGHSN